MSTTFLEIFSLCTQITYQQIFLKKTRIRFSNLLLFDPGFFFSKVVFSKVDSKQILSNLILSSVVGWKTCGGGVPRL